MSPTSEGHRSGSSVPRRRSRGGTTLGRGAWDVGMVLVATLLGCGGTAAPAPAPPPPPRPSSGERKVDDDIDTLSKKAEAALAKSSRLTPAPALAGSETYVPRRLLSIPLEGSRLSGRKRAELWITSDGGQSWVNQGGLDLAQGPASHLVPRDGRYGIVLVPLSSAGVREFTPKPGDPSDRTFVVDTVAPVVEVLAPNGGETFGGGRATVIRWMADDVNLHPEGITLEVSGDSGATWSTLRRGLPNTGSYPWEIPSLSTTHARIRVRARDLAGNEGTGTSERDFAIDARTPEFRITGPSVAREVPVKIEWTGTEDTAGLRRLTLYVSRDRGQTWAPYPEEIGLKSPILFKDLDGVYGLILVGESRVGNTSSVPLPGTPPAFTLRLDRTKPEVKIHSPQGGGVFGGVPVEVRWTARDNLDLPPNAVALYYSADDGGTWTEIKRGLVNEGSFKWIPPSTAGKDSRLKVVATDFAGNEGFAVSERFGVDISVPEARAIGPDRSNSHSVNIVYEIRNRGSAPLRKVTLYYRPEHVKEWIKYGDDPDQESPMLFAKADGKYGIYVVCATEAGLASDRRQMPPEEGTEPQLWLTIDATPPQLTLESFSNGGYVMAGAVMDVAWKMLEANPDPKGMEIQHSPDGGITWTVVATGVDPTKGTHRWIVPNSPGARHKIRLLCTDRFGNRGQVESEKPFTIDNDLPVIVIREHPPAVIRSSRLSVKFKASDPTSGIDHVALLAKKLGDAAPYKELARTPQPEGTLECDMPGEGAWACLVVAVDGAGHASAEPEPRTKPDFVTTFDVTKPVV
ncbi:MAG TPA: hypothetical protein VEN81_11455, partial [Planctomycetota bacterium]|nr:hypothetical protein [Planctomycetota bacterium]